MKIFYFIILFTTFLSIQSCTTESYLAEDSTEEVTLEKEAEIKKTESDEKLDSLSGFRNYKLGTDRSLYPNLKISTVQEYQEKVAFVDPKESNLIGDIKIDDLHFVFNKDNKLIGICFLIDESNTRELVMALVEKYGTGTVKDFNTFWPTYFENNETYLSINKHGNEKRITVFYLYKPQIAEERERLRAERRNSL